MGRDSWGSDSPGVLGGTPNAPGALVTVLGLADVMSLAGGTYHACALHGGGTVSCWGAGTTTPVQVAGLADSIAVTAGSGHTCALRGTRTVSCWGDNTSGQLGDGTTESSTTPVVVPGLENVLAIGAGAGHTCAVVGADASATVGVMRCWGANASYQAGNSDSASSVLAPSPVIGLVRHTAVDGGSAFSCSLTDSGTVGCWGNNELGSLGDGAYTSRHRAQAVIGIEGAVQVSAGGSHVCVVLASGRVRCWGANASGQLGNATIALSTEPVDVVRDW